jgi:hypothetical protein
MGLMLVKAYYLYDSEIGFVVVSPNVNWKTSETLS